MKKFVSISLIVALMFVFAACAEKSQEQEELPPETVTEEPTALQKSLEKLLECGWQATDNGYMYIETTDYCDMEINARPGDTELDMEIHYDYGDNNESMAEAYIKDSTFASHVAAMWFDKIASLTEPELEKINYIVYVGDNKVADSSMTYEEAESLASENDD